MGNLGVTVNLVRDIFMKRDDLIEPLRLCCLSSTFRWIDKLTVSE